MKLPAKKNSTNIIPLQPVKMQHPEKKITNKKMEKTGRTSVNSLIFDVDCSTGQQNARERVPFAKLCLK